MKVIESGSGQFGALSNFISVHILKKTGWYHPAYAQMHTWNYHLHIISHDLRL